MDNPIDVFNYLLSIVSSLIFCLGMCRALRMRSNVGYVVANMIVNVAYVVLIVFGVSKDLLFLPFAAIFAVVLPMAFGAEPKPRCVIKGVIGWLVYLVFGVSTVVILMVAMGGDFTAEMMQNASPILIVLIYLVEWPIFALALEGYARICRRFEGQLSDVSLIPAVGYFAIGAVLCMISLNLHLGRCENGAVIEMQYFAMFIVFYVIYVVVLVVIFWRHIGYVRSQRVLRQRQFFDLQLAAVQAGYDKVVAAQNQLRRIRHDIANHLQVMQTLVQRGEVGRAAEHLQALREVLDGFVPDGASEQDDLEKILESDADETFFDDDSAQVDDARVGGCALDGRAAMLPMAAVAFVPQIAMIVECSRGAQGPSNAWFTVPVAVVMGALCLVADVALVWMMHKKEQVINEAQRMSCVAETRRALLQFRQSAQDQSQLAASVVAQIQDALDQAERGLRAHDLGAVQQALCQGVAQIDAAGSRICDNVVASAVVSMERDRCRARGVEFGYDLHIVDETPLPQTQLAAVLFNLLDNAIQAADQVASADKRWVRVKAGVVNGSFVIDVQNSCDPRLKGDIVPDLSPRDSRGLHGWGLGNVAQIARDHDGMVSFSAVEGVFTATFVIFDGLNVISCF